VDAIEADVVRTRDEVPEEALASSPDGR